MYTIYVLRNPNGLLYKGITKNLDKRIAFHNNGRQRWTRSRGPWELIYTESAVTKNYAIKREKYLKTGHGRDFLKQKMLKTSGSSSVG